MHAPRGDSLAPQNVARRASGNNAVYLLGRFIF